MEKCGIARQSTNDNTVRRMGTASWITKVADTHSEYVILIAIPRNNCYANTHQFYVIRTLLV